MLSLFISFYYPILGAYIQPGEAAGVADRTGYSPEGGDLPALPGTGHGTQVSDTFLLGYLVSSC